MLRMPQLVPYVGDFVVLDDGRWFESWLGLRVTTGPVLDDHAWRDARLVYRGGDVHDPGFGRPRDYRNPVSRRGLNRTFLDEAAGRIWVLTQGDAMLHAFFVDGHDAGAVGLPVYGRGRDPVIHLGDVLDTISGLRRNKFVSQPSVAGLVALSDSRFATIRYTDWHSIYVGSFPAGSIEYRARSSVELFDAGGHRRAALAVPDFAIEIAGDAASGIVALIVQDRRRAQRLLFGRLPTGALAAKAAP